MCVGVCVCEVLYFLREIYCPSARDAVQSTKQLQTLSEKPCLQCRYKIWRQHLGRTVGIFLPAGSCNTPHDRTLHTHALSVLNITKCTLTQERLMPAQCRSVAETLVRIL
jgi:hypothetical protein